MNISKYYRCRKRSTPSAAVAVWRWLLLAAACAICAAAQAAENERLVVLPFEIVDNTPVAGGEARNQRMLDSLTRYVAQAIEEAKLYAVVPQARVDEAVSAANLGTEIRNCNGCEFDLARQLAGDKVMTGWIYKMSLLILTMHIEIKDVASGRTLLMKAYDFRGDNEKAWMRAARYMVRDLERMFKQPEPTAAIARHAID